MEGATVSASASALSAAVRHLAELGVELDRGEEVRGYWLEHPDMLTVTQETAAIARRLLPEDSSLRLALYRDPEIDDEYLALYGRPPTLNLGSRAVFDEIAERRAPLLRGRSGRIMILPDFAAV